MEEAVDESVFVGVAVRVWVEVLVGAPLVNVGVGLGVPVELAVKVGGIVELDVALLVDVGVVGTVAVAVKGEVAVGITLPGVEAGPVGTLGPMTSKLLWQAGKDANRSNATETQAGR